MKGKCRHQTEEKEEIKPLVYCYGCTLTGYSCDGYDICEDYEGEE